MAGKRRLNETNDSIFQSKRIFEGSSFDVHRAQPSQLQTIGTPPLDTHRAELSRQHVRALNTQFASWVQSQLQNHPDELWEDGIQDYQDHASNIKEKFSDIVNWLKAHATKEAGVFGLGSQDAPKKSVFESKENPFKLNKEQPSFSIMEQPSFSIKDQPSFSIKDQTSFVNEYLSKENASKGENVFGFGSQDASKKSVFETKENPFKFDKEQTSFGAKDQNSFGIKENLSKENGSKGESVFGLGSQDASKKSVFESKDNSVNLTKVQNPFGIKKQTPVAVKEQNPFGIKEQNSFGITQPFSFGGKEQPAFGIFGTTPNSSPSSMFTTQSSFPFGSQIAAPSNNDASNDVDGEEELQQPSSPSVKKAEEKGITVVHEVKCKLYVKSSDPADTSAWKDKGTGQLSIKCKEGVSKGSKESKPVILVRNDAGRILLNASIYPGIKTNMQKNAIVAIFHTASESGNEGGESNGVVAQTFLIRTKTEDDRDKLASAIQEHAPTA